MGKTVKMPWNHKMGHMISCGGSNPRAFEKPTDHGKHAHTPTPTKMHFSNIHTAQEMKGKRIVGCKQKEKEIGHSATMKYDSDIMKMQKMPFSGICRNLE